MIKAIFLDRDDTIIEDKNYLNDPDQIVYIEGVFTALKNLYDHGYKLIIVSNQSGIAKGIVDTKNLNEIHRRIKLRFLENQSPILDIYYCPADSDSNHPDRKPNPGMLNKAKAVHNIDMSQSWMIGDKESDIMAGKLAGCRTILFTPPYKSQIETSSLSNCDTSSLIEASSYIISQNK